MLYLDLTLFLISFTVWLILISNIDINPEVIFFSILKCKTFISLILSRYNIRNSQELKSLVKNIINS